MKLAMKIILLFSIFEAAFAAHATLFCDLDEASYEDRNKFHCEVNNNLEYAQFVNTCGEEGRGGARNWTEDEAGNSNSAKIFTQCEYYEIEPAGKTCTSDIDSCTTTGFSIVAKVKPKRPTPDEDDVAWLFGFGGGSGEGYGVEVGFQNAQVVVHVITTNVTNILECPLAFTDEKWYTLTVIRGPNEYGDIRIFMDGARLHHEDCPTRVTKKNNNPPSQKFNKIFLGSTWRSDAVLYAGLTDQICYFSEPLSNTDRTKAEDEGCGAV